jgi:hypothetical protein
MANAVNVDTWNGGQTSRTIAFTPTAGRLVVVALTSSSAFGALGGGVAVSWNAIMTEQTGQNSEHEVAYWGIATGSTGPLTYGGVAVTEGAFCEYDITTASATDDSDQAASGNGTAITSNAIVTASIDIIIGISWNGSGAVTYTGAWISDASVGNNETLAVASIVNASPGSYQLTTSSTYLLWEAVIAGVVTASATPLVTSTLRTMGQGRPPRAFRPGIAR